VLRGAWCVLPAAWCVLRGACGVLRAMRGVRRSSALRNGVFCGRVAGATSHAARGARNVERDTVVRRTSHAPRDEKHVAPLHVPRDKEHLTAPDNTAHFEIVAARSSS
jgi:hypothetical protein